MRMKKQFLLWAALGLVALQACHHEEMPVVADSGACGGDGSNLTWTLTEDGTLTISGEGEMALYLPPISGQKDLPPWYDYREDVERVVIDEGVTRIGRCAFYGHTNLALVTISSSVASVFPQAFWGCTRLTAIQVDEANPEYCSQDGVLFSKDKTSLYICPGGLQGEYAIPDGVTSIGDGAFERCVWLLSVTIPDGVTYIENDTFSGCSGLTSVDLPEGLKVIGQSAFYGCARLASITIPESVTSILDLAFYGCTRLASVNIPESVTSIEDDTFFGCASLTSITIPGAVTGIGEHAFDGCTSLASVNIPESVTSIGSGAFSGCTGLSSITSYAVMPPNLGSGVFDEVDRRIPVYVPAGSVAYYQSHVYWGEFNIQPIQE